MAQRTKAFRGKTSPNLKTFLRTGWTQRADGWGVSCVQIWLKPKQLSNKGMVKCPGGFLPKKKSIARFGQHEGPYSRKSWNFAHTSGKCIANTPIPMEVRVNNYVSVQYHATVAPSIPFASSSCNYANMWFPAGFKTLTPRLSFHRGWGLTCVTMTVLGMLSVMSLSSSRLHRKW